MTPAPRHSRHLPAFILLALAREPLHGTAIRKILQERIQGYRVDPGAIYRTLQALEEEVLVVAEWDTGTRGPARKVYTLTPAGWDSLKGWEADIRMRMGFLGAFLEQYAEIADRRPSFPPQAPGGKGGKKAAETDEGAGTRLRRGGGEP